MSTAPVFEIDLAAFAADPYPDLACMRDEAPICYVPQLGATLMTRRDDIHRQEKRIEVFSSLQPDGLMTRLMGANMMRKDGSPHLDERRILFPALSPRTVASHWRPIFEETAHWIVAELRPRGACNFVTDYAMPVSAEALKAITGLTGMTAAEMDGVSQAMIDGCANYAGDPAIEARCHAATALIDRHIDARMSAPNDAGRDAISVQRAADLPLPNLRANIKLIISGGQNEPRDAIAGTTWALLSHPDQLAMIRDGRASWQAAFDEYARWISPIGMSPRRVAQTDVINSIRFDVEDRVFLMFGSAGRDADHFSDPDRFDIIRNTQPAISFGAGPHFCAGAAAARCLIADVALPVAFNALPNLRLDGDVPFTGWAFRGPVRMPVAWDA